MSAIMWAGCEKADTHVGAPSQLAWPELCGLSRDPLPLEFGRMAGSV